MPIPDRRFLNFLQETLVIFPALDYNSFRYCFSWHKNCTKKEERFQVLSLGCVLLFSGTFFTAPIDAYKAGDLKTLEEIVAIIEGKADADSESPLEALLKEKARLLEMIERIREEIRSIRAMYPFDKLDILDNPEKLAAVKRELKEKLERLREKADAYRQRIEALEKEQNAAETEK